MLLYVSKHWGDLVDQKPGCGKLYHKGKGNLFFGMDFCHETSPPLPWQSSAVTTFSINTEQILAIFNSHKQLSDYKL